MLLFLAGLFLGIMIYEFIIPFYRSWKINRHDRWLSELKKQAKIDIVTYFDSNPDLVKELESVNYAALVPLGMGFHRPDDRIKITGTKKIR